MSPHFSFRHIHAITFAAFAIFATFANMLATIGDASAQGFKFLEVKVVDPDGHPMANVAVEINIGAMKFPMPTDADGKVEVNVPTGERTELEIRVRHEDYVAMGVAWRGDEKIPESVTIPLAKGVSFGGIVHDQQGQPVDGAQVSGAMFFENRHGFVHDGKVMPFLDGELATTNKEGRWQCSMAPEGDIRVELSFSHPNFLDLNNRKFATWQELKRQKKIAVLGKGVVLAGQVLRPDGSPAERIKLEIMQIEERGYGAWETLTDEEGNFTTQPIRKGPAIISVENLEYAPLQKSVDVTPEVEPQVLQLERGRPMLIKVVNDGGEPLVNANVSVTDWLYSQRGIDLRDNYSTDEQGIWRWEHAPSGEMTYKISASGYRESKNQLVASDELQTVTLRPAIKIVGHVVDKHTREPIKKFKLMGVAAIDCGLNQRCEIAFGMTELTTSGDYNFEAGLLCNEFRVSCSAVGYNNGVSRTIKSDEDEVAFDFELERETEEAADTPK